MASAQSGNLYIGLFRSKLQDEDTTRKQLIENLKFLLRSEHSDSLSYNNIEDWENLGDDTWTEILNEILDTILPDDTTRVLCLSNCTSQKKDCRIKECPLDSSSDCALSCNDCSVILMRPQCNTPSIDAMFPQSEVLALKCFVTFCPYRDGGSTLSARHFTWAPKSDCRPFEVEVNAHIHWGSTKQWEQRPANLLVPQLFQNLPAMSLKTAERLKDWRDYLNWRTRLINANKRGIRYVGYKLLPESGNVVFSVVSESQEEFRRSAFWRNNAVYAYPLSNSDNPWKFHEIEEWKNRKWGKSLGDFIREDINIIQPQIIDCPWHTPYVTGLIFELHSELQSDFLDYKEANGEAADLNGWLEREGTFQPQGFLSISAVGDESLLRRLNRTLTTFASEGSIAAPFLSSYLFDISQARLPKKHPAIKEWQNPNMNEAQKRAVQTMIDAPDIAMIQGPPGTGKTTVIAEAIYQFVKKGKKVLLASQSNAAVINALERLADLPEIRPINLIKQQKDDTRQADNQYSPENVLKDFYANLGEKVKTVLDGWKQNTEHLKTITSYNGRLAAIHDRLTKEQQFIENSTARITEKRKDLAGAQEALEESNQQLAQRNAGKAFINNLLAKDISEAEGLNSEAVPEPVVEVAEKNLLPMINSMAAKGIRLTPERYDREASNDIRCRWLKVICDTINNLLSNQVGQVSKDLVRLQGMTGDTVTSSENSLKIAELKQKRQQLEAEMDKADDDNDNDLYNELRKKHKALREEEKRLAASGSLPKQPYEAIFNSVSEDGKNWADYILSPERKRKELIDILSNFELFFQKIVADYSSANVNIRNEGDKYLSSMRIDGRAQKTLNHAKAEYDKEVASRVDAERRRNDFMRQANDLLQEMVQNIALPENFAKNIDTAISWCEQAIAELNRREKENLADKKLYTPVYEKWLGFLEHPNDSDKGQVLDTYLENCSVVGLTCSADPKLLTDRGYDHFEVVIIDEVSKTTPPELMLSMVMAEKTILVGDHRQLPPLFGDREPLAFEEVVQRDGEDESIPNELKITEENFKNYKRMVVASLFKEHFENAPDALKSMLWIQYRMHPDIMNVINEFYENRLECGLSNPDLERNHSISSKDVDFIQDNGHAYWIDSTYAPDGKFWADDKSGTSFENYLEAVLIFKTLIQLDEALEGKKKNNKPIKKTVGIISFYGRQAGLLKKMGKSYKFNNFSPRIETVDRFQGQERDYILISMTRNPQHRAIRGQNSFMAQFERINVAFSRARELLLIYGARDMCDPYEISLPPLMGGTKITKHKIYQRIIASLDRRGCLVLPSRIITKEDWETLKTQYKPPRGSTENSNVREDRQHRSPYNKNFGNSYRNFGDRNKGR